MPSLDHFPSPVKSVVVVPERQDRVDELVMSVRRELDLAGAEIRGVADPAAHVALARLSDCIAWLARAVSLGCDRHA